MLPVKSSSRLSRLQTRALRPHPRRLRSDRRHGHFRLHRRSVGDKNADTYPGSTYYGPKTINCVTINSINGKPFRAKDTYAVSPTTSWLAAGGDVYYAFASSPKIVDTGTPMDEAVVDYIKTELKGVVGKEYAEPQGRINMATYNDVPSNIWYTKAVDYVTEKKFS